MLKFKLFTLIISLLVVNLFHTQNTYSQWAINSFSQSSIPNEIATINWFPFGGGVNGTVWAIKVSGNDVYVGGSFTSVNGGNIFAKRIAKWDGSSWSKFGDGIAGGVVRAIALDGNNLYVGGTFTETGSGMANRIAKWDGTTWSSLGTYPNDGVNGPVYAIAISGGYVYVGGSFSQAGGVSVNNIAKWSASEGWSSVGSGFNNEVYALAVKDSEIYAGGGFTQSGSNPVKYIAKWNGTSWQSLGLGVSGYVWAIEISGSDIYVGGSFNIAGDNIPAKKIAKWNGASWSGLGEGLNDDVYGISFAGKYLYAVGRFTQAGGNAANYIARWGGSSWTALGSGVNNILYTIAKIKKTGEIAIGGNFSNAGGNPINYLARFTDSQNPFQTKTGWKWLNPLPQGNNLRGLHLFDENSFIAVGDYGTVVKTTNSGVDYFVAHKISSFNGILTSVHFPTNSTGYAVGSTPSGVGKIFKSPDGGLNWSVLNLPNPNDVPQLNDVYFVSENTGWTCGNSPSSGTTIYKTTDGGNNWIDQSISSVTTNLVKMNFENENKGYAAGTNGTFLETTNGGSNWIIKTLNGPVDLTDYFQDPSGNWHTVSKNGSIHKSTDKGTTWTQKYSGVEELLSIYFPDSTKGYAVGKNGTALYTTNGGENWNAGTSNSPFDLNKVKGKNNQLVGFAAGVGGDLLKTTDGGKTWKEILILDAHLSSTLESVKFLDENIGFVSNKNYILKTTDGGESWHTLDVPSGNQIFNNLTFTDNNKGVVLANHNDILRTTDGGNSWVKVLDLESGRLSCIHHSGGDNLFAGGSEGKILKSSNGGANWQEVSTIISSMTITSITDNKSGNLFLTANTSSSLNAIYKSTNGGLDWTPIHTGDKHLNSITFLNSTVGIAVGPGFVLRTSDGGNTWTETNLDNTTLNKALNIGNSIYAIGWLGSIYKSTDQGLTWNKHESNTNIELKAASFTTSSSFKNDLFIESTISEIGWIVGENGIILKTEDGGEGGVIINVKDDFIIFNQPSAFLLYQNYPNPFNPNTTIKFSLSKDGITTLKIYDILGREIATLVNEPKQAGEYQVEFNANKYGLSSGVYFYQLKFGNFTLTKKFVMIK